MGLPARLVVGGIASKLGGGEFASGALSAAFEELYNRGGRRLRDYQRDLEQFHLNTQAAMIRQQFAELGVSPPAIASSRGGMSRETVNEMFEALQIAATRAAANAQAQARRHEVARVKLTGEGSIQWSQSQIDYIRQNNRLPPNYDAHHRNPVSQFPGQAGNLSNIRIMSHADHVNLHRIQK
jgi:hypothetical protein